jgi:hypothetical protein
MPPATPTYLPIDVVFFSKIKNLSKTDGNDEELMGPAQLLRDSSMKKNKRRKKDQKERQEDHNIKRPTTKLYKCPNRMKKGKYYKSIYISKQLHE